jgi:hypothetical protein
VNRGSRFQVLDVFRIAQRSGPILLGRLEGETISVGSRLVLSAGSAWEGRVVALEMPTPKSIAEGTEAVVVTPDDEGLTPGVTLLVLDPSTG